MDFEREGLLDGVESEQERASRHDLLEQLVAKGVGLEELRRAVTEDRLALLPVELVFAPEGRHTVTEAATETGIDEQFLGQNRLALGLSRPGATDPAFSDEDIVGLHGVRQLLEAGVTEEQMLDLARVVGQGSARIAWAVLELLGRVLLRAGDTERDVGLRYADTAMALTPLMAPMLVSPVRLHMEEIIRREVVGRAERASGRLPGSREVAVCFADLVGFTSLGEALDVGAIGDVARRLETMAGEVAKPPVRLIKMIGDAAMLVSDDANALIGAALGLVDMAEQAGEEFPRLRVGAAYGLALGRSGDWYGRPVNLASRITAVAEPGSVVVTRDIRDVVGHDYRWSRAQTRTFKGIQGAVELFRLTGADSPVGPAG